MANQRLSKNDIDFDNQNFWIYYISGFRGYDEEKELNLDEAISEVVDIDKLTPSFDDWYNDFLPKKEADAEGFFENPKMISEKVTNNIWITIEFHLPETIFYINDFYIGNLGGHFECWFITLKELLALDKYDFLFLLFLPMTGVEKNERAYAEELISQKLKSISLFEKQSDYIAKCIVNGLLIDEGFDVDPEIGIISNTNHSVRNIMKYPRYKEDVIEINRALRSIVDIKE